MLSRFIRFKARDLCLVPVYLRAAAHPPPLWASIPSSRRGYSNAQAEVKEEIEISLSADLPRLPWQRKPDTRNIIVDDLEATIEAHRRSNLTGISDARNLVRKVPLLKDSFEPHENGLSGKPGYTNSNRGKASMVSNRASDIDSRSTTTQILPSNMPETGLLNQAAGKEQTSVPSIRGQSRGRQKHITQDGYDSKSRRLWLRSPPLPPKDYIGSIPDPRFEWNRHGVFESELEWTSPSATRPWLKGLEFNTDSEQRLHEEIEAFEQYVAHTPAETAAIEESMRDVHAIISEILPSHQAILHGSRATGLATVTSDIDFSIAIPNIPTETTKRGPSSTNPRCRKIGRRVLEKIREVLIENRRFTKVGLIEARIPLVTAIDHRTGLVLQFQTLAPVTGSREYTSYYLNEIPSLRPLLMVIRHGLKIRGLTDVFFGGIGTYSLLMMIVAALKHEPRMQSNNLGAQLKHVLSFYSDADLEKYGFAIEPPAKFAKRTSNQASDKVVFDAINMRSSEAPYLLCLQDPADPTNDLGSKSHQIKHVQATFRSWNKRIGRISRKWDSEEPHIRLKNHDEDKGSCLLGSVATAVFQKFEARRKAILGKHQPRRSDSESFRKLYL